jgi:flagellar L-ring protein precursor FlgH
MLALLLARRGIPVTLLEAGREPLDKGLASIRRSYESSARKGKLSASMTVEVKAVSPAGNLWVQGDKVVMVNNEDQHIVLSGWVRPEDIDARNQVASTRLAQARIDYYGEGPVGRQQGAGWGMVVLDYLWPF